MNAYRWAWFALACITVAGAFLVTRYTPAQCREDQPGGAGTPIYRICERSDRWTGKVQETSSRIIWEP
jgi:hypothetical protein